MSQIDDQAKLALWCHSNPDEAAAEIERLREAVVMTLNRLEAAVLGDDRACEHCIDVAMSYLRDATPHTNGERRAP